MEWASQRQSLAEHFAQQVQNGSNYLLSSRASRKLHEQGDEAEQQIQRFKVEIQKRFLLSVANKFYSFPYTQLSFDNPFQDEDIADLVGRGVYCLYTQEDGQLPQQIAPQVNLQSHRQQQSKSKSIIQQLRNERSKLTQILDLISNRKMGRQQQRKSQSKQRKLGYKYGVIKQEDEQALRKRLYTEPYEKQSGFIVKKK